MNQASKSAFHTYHPAVACVFLVCVIVLSMVAVHPVYVCLSCMGACICSCTARGLKKTLQSLTWIIPLWLIVMIANFIFVHAGATELFRIGVHGFSLEALVYGFCSGGMLAAVFMWFLSYAAVMTAENSLSLLGNVAPVITLMISQIMRLVPQFVFRGREISAAHNAATDAAAQSKKEQAQDRMRVISVLMGWGMEDGIIRSDSMRARGYGCGIKRTTYQRYRFCFHDGIVVAVTLCLTVVSAALMYVACSQFEFYPTMSTLVVWWGYIPYGLLLLIPVVLQVKEWWQWQSLK